MRKRQILTLWLCAESFSSDRDPNVFQHKLDAAYLLQVPQFGLRSITDTAASPQGLDAANNLAHRVLHCFVRPEGLCGGRIGRNFT